MNTIAIEIDNKQTIQSNQIPVTARGRALYTIDWFLNGKPTQYDHDNPGMPVYYGSTINA